jgi:hypothetical protein
MTLSKHELADLDAGWDEPEAEPAPPRVIPNSTPPELGELDEGWDDPPAPVAAAVAPKPQAAERPLLTRAAASTSSPARRSGASAGPAPNVQPEGKLPLTKRERRELERRQRKHSAKLQAVRRKERKKARSDEARRRRLEREKAASAPTGGSSGKRRTRKKKPVQRHAAQVNVTSMPPPKKRILHVAASDRKPQTSSAEDHRDPAEASGAESEVKARRPRGWGLEALPYAAGLMLLTAIVVWWVLR